jgi:hypothetical protein
MADDLKNTGKADDIRINVNQAHEVAYWTKKWGVTEAQLKAAVSRVGVMVKDVQKALGK